MTDEDALNFLAQKLGSKVKVAVALCVSAQQLNNWYERGISAAMRPAVWAMVNDHGGNLPRDWLFPKVAA